VAFVPVVRADVGWLLVALAAVLLLVVVAPLEDDLPVLTEAPVLALVPLLEVALVFAAAPLGAKRGAEALVEACGLDVVLGPCARKGTMAYTIIETTANRATVNNVPMILPRGERSVAVGPGRLNEDSRAASRGSSAESRRSISASMRCSSIDSAIAPYLRVPRDASGNSLTIPHEGWFIQSF
jgi:hypothetical protein